MASDDLRARIDAAIRPNMLIGLQDAELHDEPGKERINEWADWISRRIAELVQPELDELRAKITALEASYEVVAADAMAHGLCSMKRHSLLQRAEKAEAELARLRAPSAPCKHGVLPGQGLCLYCASEQRATVPGVDACYEIRHCVMWGFCHRCAPELAAEPTQPSPEHQAVYLDDYDQLWCDYPTVPSDDQVLPLVWASEQAQSRSDLADGGNRLRVIGWCR